MSDWHVLSSHDGFAHTITRDQYESRPEVTHAPVRGSGPVTERPPIVVWRDRAACLGHDTSLFFPADSHVPNLYREALALCERCEVRVECLRYAIEAGETDGVWGGVPPNGRGRR